MTAEYCPSCGSGVDLDSTPTLTHVRPRESTAHPNEAQRSQRAASTGTPAPSSRPGSAGQYVAGDTLVERYRIVAILGKGGMGEVYRAEDLRLGQTVALKFLPLSMTRDEAARERFHREVRLAREIAHPNICRVFDIGEVDDRLFLTMEYIDGEDLSSLLRRIGQLPKNKALDIARQLCAGIAAAHGHGVLHRDLKPANIMLDGRGRVRITDFGLASFAENLDAAALQAGTPAYMAPEQFAGKEVTPRSDIYALGLVLYEIFTGKKAFDAATLPELIRQREKSAPSNLSVIVPDIDPLIERVILRCLEKDPARRPATALQVAAALPGGDPLAAALAAGETPSPEMIAAAGEKEGLRPGIAWACLLLALVGLSAIVLLAKQLTVFDAAPLPNPTDVLVARAQEIVRQLGYTAAPTDTFYGFGAYTGYIDWVAKHDFSKARWKNVATGVPPLVAFWYRQSPQFLESSTFSFSQTVVPDDPPNTISGACQVLLDPQGHLVNFEAVPPQMDTSSGAPPPTNWTALFAAAGLDMNSFRPASPQWTPLVTSDIRAAWEGNWPGRPELSLRVEAASYRGMPVYFDLISPWTKPDRMREEQSSVGKRIGSGLLIFALFVVLFFGILLASRNLRTGRADRRGAFRLALFVFLLTWAAGLLFEHHVPTTHELTIFWMATGWGLIAGTIVWLLYLAIESHVRRVWPNSLISWSRLLAGQWRDSLVGRDLLVGILVGVFSVAIARGSRFFTIHWLNKYPLPPISALDYIELAGLRFTVADVLLNLVIFVFGALAFFLTFFLLRRKLRKDWLAAIVMLALFAGPSFLGDNPVLNFAGNAVTFGLMLFVLMRFGLLALVVTLVLNNVLQAYPLTAHLTAWYAEPTIFVMVLLLVGAIFGFYTATRGQPIFGRLALEE
jgi:predicted Ser/Thr protein kinase